MFNLALAISYIIIFLTPILSVWLFFLQYRDARYGMFFVLTLWMLDAFFTGPIGIPLGINLLLPDMVFLTFAATGILRLIFNKKVNSLHFLLLFWGVFLLYSFLRGTVNFGTTAGVEFRGYFYLWSGLLYFTSFHLKSRDLNFLFKILFLASFVICILVIYRWVLVTVGVSGMPWMEANEKSRFRVLASHHSFFILQTFILGSFLYLKGIIKNRALLLISVLLFIVFVGLQHRTVWVCGMASLGYLMIYEKEYRKNIHWITLFTAFFIVAVFIGILLNPQFGETLVYKLIEEPFSKNSTFMWRIDSWIYHLSDVLTADWQTFLLGFPFGSGFYRYMPELSMYIDTQPHSMYVQLLSRTGLMGLFSFLFVIIVLFRSLFKNKNYAHLFLVLLLSSLLFSITYNLPYIQCITFGIMYTYVNRYSKEERVTTVHYNSSMLVR